MPIQSIYSVATLPNAVGQPGNVVIIADATDAEYLDAGTIPVGGGTKRMRVKSNGVVWLTYGMVRQSVGEGGGTDPITELNLVSGANDFGNGAWTFDQGSFYDNPGAANQSIKELAITAVHNLGQQVAFIGPGRVRLQLDVRNTLSRNWVKPLLFDNLLTSFTGVFFNIATGAIGSTQTGGTKLSGLSILPPAPIASGYTVGFELDVDATVLHLYYFIYIANGDLVDVYAGNIANGIEANNARLYRIA